jgi:hypothetical protein
VILEFRALMKEFSFWRRRGGSVVSLDNRSSGMDTLRRFCGVDSGGLFSLSGWWSADLTRMGPPPSSSIGEPRGLVVKGGTAIYGRVFMSSFL